MYCATPKDLGHCVNDQCLYLRHDTNLQIKEHPDSRTLEDNEYNNI